MARDWCLLARRHDQQVVLTLPGGIDMTNSPRIREATFPYLSAALSG